MTLSIKHRRFSVGRILAQIAATYFAITCFATALAFGDVRVEAFRGEPFGIGRVIVDLLPGNSSAPATDDRFALTEEKARVLYPVIENKASRRILRGLLGIDGPSHVTFLFMFRGDDPLNIVAHSPAPQVVS